MGACGIAVRAIAGHVSDKRIDPAVICVDEAARYVIPILSGHIGGANRLAVRLARELHAEPVVTTATDVNGRFSVDAWASEHNMALSDMGIAKRVSAEILSRDIPVFIDRDGFTGEKPEAMRLPNGLYWDKEGELGVCISIYDRHPFDQTLLLIPRVLRIGIGCRRGIGQDSIASAVDALFARHKLRQEAIAEAASIDVKSDEAGLAAFCHNRHWPVRFYYAQALRDVPGTFNGSGFVMQTVGVDNV